MEERPKTLIRLALNQNRVGWIIAVSRSIEWQSSHHAGTHTRADGYRCRSTSRSGRQNLLGPHIGLGFVVATVVFVMAIIAMIRKAVVPGILGVVFAMLLPVVGFMQLPLIPHTMGAIQAAHIFLALAIIGVAERLYSAIQHAD